MVLLIAICVSVLAIAAVLATVLGLPGTWIMVAIAALLAWLVDPGTFLSVSWPAVAMLACIATAGEIVEFVASAAGVGRLGGARRSAWLALAGSMAGAVAGLFVGLPIPVVGPLVTSVLLGGCGAAAGALVGERWKGKDWSQSTRVGIAAAVGRLLGTVGKSVCAAIMAVILLWQVWR